MEQNDDVLEIDLIKLFRLFLSKIHIIIICAFLCASAAFGYSSYFIKPKYQSTAYIYVNNSNVSIGGASLSLSSADLSASQKLVDTYIVILETRNTLETVISKANLNYDYAQLKGMISASAVNGTEIFSVTATSTDPEEAKLIVNTIAEVFPDKVVNIVTGTSAKIVDYGVVNRKKVEPSVTKYSLIGGVIGALLACFVIFMRSILDNTIRSEEQVSSSYDVPVLAVIPDLFGDKSKGSYYYYYEEGDEKKKKKKKRRKKKKLDEATNEGNNPAFFESFHFDAKEAHNLLRTNLQFTLPNDNKCKVIGVTSAIRGEGKSTTSISLAYTLAQSNSKVLLIDGDLRLPSIGTKLNIKNRVGLSDFIIGKATAQDVINTYKESNYFHIMLSGSIPPNPSELLGSEGMANALAGLRNFFDYIVVDLPPVNIVTDALVIREMVDGYIIVVRENYSDKYMLADCMRQVEFIEANILGFVITDSTGGATYYNSGHYHYYSKYGSKYKKYGYRRYGNKYGKYRYHYSKYAYRYGKYGNKYARSYEQARSYENANNNCEKANNN